MLDISVVINTKDRADSLRLCLAALEAQTLDASRWEVIVVDDGSADDSVEIVTRAYRGGSSIRLIRRPHGGCSAARNVGIEAATGQYVLFLGDDILTEPDLLAEHLAAHERWPHAAVVGPYVWECDMPSAVFREFADTCRFGKIRDPHNATWRFFYTGNASVERQALLDVGGFDENFFRYAWEDMDLGLRLEKAGLRIIYHQRASAQHNHPFVSLESICRAEREQSFSACYFFEKWKNEPDLLSDRFWKKDPFSVSIGAPWRKKLARGIIHGLERFFPFSPLLRFLYERLIWSCRYEGIREGMQYYGKLLERYHTGEIKPEETVRRFQGL